ncbi:hypothetical protein Tco_1408688 [Tanacetum coccineum]
MRGWSSTRAFRTRLNHVVSPPWESTSLSVSPYLRYIPFILQLRKSSEDCSEMFMIRIQIVPRKESTQQALMYVDRHPIKVRARYGELTTAAGRIGSSFSLLTYPGLNPAEGPFIIIILFERALFRSNSPIKLTSVDLIEELTLLVDDLESGMVESDSSITLDFPDHLRSGLARASCAFSGTDTGMLAPDVYFRSESDDEEDQGSLSLMCHLRFEKRDQLSIS